MFHRGKRDEQTFVCFVINHSPRGEKTIYIYKNDSPPVVIIICYRWFAGEMVDRWYSDQLGSKNIYFLRGRINDAREGARTRERSVYLCST